MSEYKRLNITCYCGKHFDNMNVGEDIVCSCGVTLHTKQKKRGTGKAWGTVKNKRAQRKLKKLVQSGQSKLDAIFIE